MSLAERQLADAAGSPMRTPAPAADRQPRRRIAGRVFATAGFFVLRSPTLPVSDFTALGEGLRAPNVMEDDDRLAEALRDDRRTVRHRLAAAAERPKVREALYVASPSLVERFSGWNPDADDDKGRQYAHGLNRYFCRMSCRATPFGLFAGCSLGRIGGSVNLELDGAETYRRYSRLDMNYLSKLLEGFEEDSVVRDLLKYEPNPNLYAAADRLRYIESRVDNARRSQHLVAVDTDEYLDRVLELAAGGATLGDLAAALVAFDPEIEPAEARDYLEELVTAQILVSELTLPVTGRDAAAVMSGKLQRLVPDDDRVAVVDRACTALAELDAARLGNAPADYRRIADGLQELPAEVDPKHLVQIDLFKPGEELSLSGEVAKEVLRAAEVLSRLRPARQDTALDNFQQKYTERYGDREMPLTEVLDEEVGLGFASAQGPMVEDAPLLAGLGLPTLRDAGTMKPDPAHRLLLGKLTEAAAAGRTSIEITEEDLEGFPHWGLPLADAHSVMCALVAASSEDVAAGDYRLCVKSITGPSGARLLGRFCHLDRDLTDAVAGHLRREEALNPEAIHAEIVHLPEGRLGNILFRPLLRPWEITISGSSSVDPEHRIALSDLMVRVDHGRVVLRSRRLDKEVIPRLTSAHNFGSRSIGLYTFLCMLQLQGVVPALGWSWGALAQASFLPRVTCGRAVLSRATWRLDDKDVKRLSDGDDVAFYRAVQRMRQERRMPRLIELVDGDNCLPIDLDNAVSVGTLLHLVRKRHQVTLEEFYPAPDEMPLRGPEGVFAHEIIVPIERQPEPDREEEPPADASVAPDVDVTPEVFLPGSEWLFAKLYCGTTNADRVLEEVVLPLAAQETRARRIDRWFFMRYGDPEWHLRLRFRGPAATELLARLHELAAPLVASGVLRDIVVASYERETRRYGGRAAIGHAEEMFRADSEAVLAVLECLAGDPEARWQLALLGMDMLLDDLGLDLEAKRELVKTVLAGYRSEFRVGKQFNKKVGKRFRIHHKSLDALLFDGVCGTPALRAGRECLLRRRERWADACAALLELDRREELAVPLEDVARSLVHMHANRMLRSAARAQELVINDLQHRIYDSRLARARQKHARGHA